MSDILPTSIERSEDGIVIQWSDGASQGLSATKLREACPCATCREKHQPAEAEKQPSLGLLPVLSAAEARPLSIERMRPVGNYAYNIAFSDEHDSGIFTFDFLRQLT